MKAKTPILDLNASPAGRRSAPSSAARPGLSSPPPGMKNVPPQVSFRAMAAKSRTLPFRGLIGVTGPSSRLSKRDILSLVLLGVVVVALVVLVVQLCRDYNGTKNFVKKSWEVLTAVCAVFGVNIALYVRRLLQRLNLPADLVPQTTPPSQNPST